MRKFLTLTLFIATAVAKPATTHAQAANVNDSLALVDFYDSTGGPNWTNNSGWLTEPVKNWFGITLDLDGSVTEIYLPTNLIAGNLTSSLGNLKNLLVLNLSQNFNLTGVIPDSLNNLINLQSLDLHQCQLSGNIPNLVNLIKLQYLDLGNNKLMGIIPRGDASKKN